MAPTMGLVQHTYQVLKDLVALNPCTPSLTSIRDLDHRLLNRKNMHRKDLKHRALVQDTKRLKTKSQSRQMMWDLVLPMVVI